ncbi:MAG: C4-dicarboxylate ABC transporter substrate-binding protein, partial [Polynucleobacter sp.]
KILIPLLIILLPIFTYLPVILNLSLKIRLGRLYKTLKTIEKRFAASKNTDELLSGLNDLENRIERLNVSAIQSKELYDLRMHIALVRDQLKQAK